MYQLMKKHYSKPEQMPGIHKTEFRRKQDWHRLEFYTDTAQIKATCLYMNPVHVLEIVEKTEWDEVRTLVELEEDE